MSKSIKLSPEDAENAKEKVTKWIDLIEEIQEKPEALEKLAKELQQAMNFVYYGNHTLTEVIKAQYETIKNLKKQIK